jgi:hypothetical protein
MAVAPARRKSRGTAIPVICETEPRSAEFEKTLHARIAERARQIFERNGFAHGRDLANWLQAEAQLLSEIRDLTETGSWLTARAPLVNAVPEGISVLVRRDAALVCVEAWEIADDSPDTDSLHRVVYLKANWPNEVDPSTASAYLKDGVVTLSAKNV